MRRNLYKSSPHSAARRFALAAISFSPLGLLAAAPASVLPTPRSLKEAIDAASSRQQPLIIMVSLQGCSFCKLVRESYLAPLYARGAIQVAQLDMQSARALENAAGHPSTHGQVIHAWGVKVAPTLLFLGRLGNEVADRLNGVPSIDYYGAMLEQRLAAASQAMQPK